MKTPLRVLHIEDSDLDSAVIVATLTDAGFDVSARRVDSAADLRRELEEPSWDIAIADYTMPGFSGVKALNMVRDARPDLPFIFVSGTIGEETAVAAMRSGAQDYVTKANLARLAPVVERELREATVRRERHLANQRVDYLTYHDSLTDLPNRILFLDRLQQAILRSDRDEKGLAVLLIDLDGFQEINESLGNHVGDLVLQEVATRLHGAVRVSDTVARIGGDSFAVLLPGIDIDRAELAARKVLQDLERPFAGNGRPLTVTASIGIAGVPLHAATSAEVLRNASAAMSLAKHDKAGFTVYQAARDRGAKERVSLASAMRQAIEEREFELDYQPIVSLRTNAVLAIESLVRWNHPEFGRLLPDDFIGVAEHTGLINPLTSFVLERAVAEWPNTALPDRCGITVNVSARSLRHAAFTGRIHHTLEQLGLPPSSLVLEITEHLLMADPDGSIRRLEELHDMGVRLVIDDFGKGYSSLSYLRQLPVDEIKIDRSFITGLAAGEDDTLVRCMIDLAHNLGLTIVAEGVETEAVLEQLTGLECDAAQGYLIRKPASAVDTSHWLTSRPQPDA